MMMKKLLLFATFYVISIFSVTAQWSFTQYNNTAITIPTSTQGVVGVTINRTSGSGNAGMGNFLKITLPAGITYVPGGTLSANLTETGGNISNLSAPVLVLNANYSGTGSKTFTFTVNLTCTYNGTDNIQYEYDNSAGTVLIATKSYLPVITKNNIPPAPVVAGITTTAIGNSTTLMASNTAIPTGAIYKWYSDAGLTNLVGSGTSFTTPPSAIIGSVNYYVTVAGPNYCQTSTATMVTVQTIANGASISDITAASQTICNNAWYISKSSTAIAGTSVTLRAYNSGTGPNGTISNPIIKWYDDIALTHLVYTGANYGTNVTGPASYYVTIENATLAPNNPGLLVKVDTGNCGSPTFVSNCNASTNTSTKLSSETFGQGTTTPVQNKPGTYASNTQLPAGTTTYGFATSGTYPPQNDNYSIAQVVDGGTSGAGFTNWLGINQLRDHTGNQYGYMGVFNASTTRGTFYTKVLTGLCPGSKLYFSAWAVSLFKLSKGGIDPNLAFVLTNPTDNTDTLAVLQTGSIPNGDNTWRQYAFEFKVPAEETSVKLSIVNNVNGGDGDDLALDDIEVYVCKPVASITPSKSFYCMGDIINLTANFNDNGTYGTSFAYQWYYSKTNDPDFPGTSWNPLGTPTTANNFTTPPTTATDTGYYKLVVGSPINILQKSFDCTVISNAERIEVRAVPVVTPIITSTQTIEVGNTTTFNDGTPGGIWSSDNTGIATVNTSGLVTGKSTGSTNINYTVTTNGCSAAVANIINVTSLLPVKFLSFSAVPSNNSIALKWEVAPELKNQSFIIQYSSNGRDFTSIATLSYINNTTQYNYNYPTKVSGTYYFRIIGKDNDNVLTYTTIKKVIINENGDQAQLQISPNPASDILTLQLDLKSMTTTNAHIRIFDMKGVEFMRSEQHITGGLQNIQLNIQPLTAGVYLLQVNWESGTRILKFVKAK